MYFLSFSKFSILRKWSRSTSLAAPHAFWMPARLILVVISLDMHTTKHTYQRMAARAVQRVSRLCLVSFCRSLPLPSLRLESPVASKPEPPPSLRLEPLVMKSGPFISNYCVCWCLCIPNKMLPGVCVTFVCLLPNVERYICMIAELIVKPKAAPVRSAWVWVVNL